MYFSTTVAFVTLSFLVGARAVPVSHDSPRSVISIPLSRRLTHLNVDGLVDVDKMQANVHRAVARIERGVRAFERNTGEPHPLTRKIRHSNERRAPVIALGSDSDTFDGPFIGVIQVGTPPKNFSVVFDTTIPDMFIPGINCSNCTGLHTYNLSQSSTGIDLMLNSTIQVDFGILGQVQGEVFSDNVLLAQLQATHQELLVASSYSTKLLSPNFGADGIMGLGFQQASAYGGNSVFQKLIDRGVLKNGGLEPVFAFALLSSRARPELVIGGSDSSLFSGNLKLVDVEANKGFWQVSLDSISVNGKVAVSAGDAIFDTGSPFIVGDQDTIASIYDNIPGSIQISSSLWTIPCNTNVTVTMSLSGVELSIAPDTYSFSGPVPHSAPNTCLAGFSGSSTIKPGLILIGTILMGNYYTQFDQGNMQIGFAPHA